MKNERLNYFVLGMLIATFGIIMLKIGKQQQIKQQHEAYSICSVSHFDTGAQSETACAKAQDLTHTEFICSATGQYCWLEVK